MGPLTLAALASALGPALVTVLTKLAEKGLADPALEPLTEWLSARVKGGYDAAKDAAKLKAVLSKTLKPIAESEHYARWQKAFSALHQDAGLLARATATAVEMTTNRPELISSELVRDLQLDDAERPALADWLLALRKELAGMEGYQTGIRYADELHFIHRLDGLYELVAGVAATVMDTAGGPALRAQMIPPDTRALEEPYLKYVMNEFAGVPLEGRSTDDTLRADDQLRLERVYIALNTTEPGAVPLPEEDEDKNKDKEMPDWMRAGRGERQSRSALRALSESRRLLVLGDPGSGKSTLAQHLCLCLAGARLNPQSDWPGRLAAGDLERWPLALYPLPLFIRLRLFASDSECLPDDAKQRGQAKHLLAYLRKMLAEQNWANLTDQVVRLLENGQALVVFDGLDEVADPARRVNVALAIYDFAFKRFPHARVLATCRAKQYPQDAERRPLAPWRLAGFPAVTLADFDPEQIEAFVRHWFAELQNRGRLPDPDEKTQSLLTAFATRPELGRDLAPKPILLTQMALIHAVRRLPDSRIDVYAECARLLLWEWEQLKARHSGRLGESAEDYLLSLNVPGLRLSEVEDALDKAVFQAHEHGAAEVAADLLRRALRETFQEFYKLDAPRASYCAEAFIEGWLRGRNGLLLPEGEESFNVPHRSFREFMAARHLRENALTNPTTGDDEDWKLSGPRLVKANADAWREVLRFAAGLAALPEVPTALNELCPEAVSVEPTDVQSLLLAGEMARDVGAHNLSAKGGKLGRHIYARLENQLWHLMRDTAEGDYPTDKPRLTSPALLSPQTRLAAGDLLDVLGWTPPDLCDFVPVYKTDAVDGRMRSQRPESVHPGNPLFFIARHLTTNLHYQRFLDSDDYRDPDLWHSLIAFDAFGRPQDLGNEPWKWFHSVGLFDHKPGYWDNARFGRSHRLLPVVGVTWYEAAAYCVWLTRHWRDWPEAQSLITNNPLPLNLIFRLPLESEWLLAAGGLWPDKAVEEKTPRYVWQTTPGSVSDDELRQRANTGESGLGGASPVGMYPAGASPLGLMDMAGNVWEWQANLYQKGESYRALRGGSWHLNHDFARAAARLWYDGGHYWNYDVGVRVVASPG